MQGSTQQIATTGAVVLLMVLGAAIESWWRRLRERARARAIVRRGVKGERDAEKLLKKLGYTLLARQAPASYGVLLDGEAQAFQLNADFLVERQGQRLVAEVKTGKSGRIDHAETRRQLLEYQLAFGVDALLLVDMESRTVRTVRFPLPRARSAAVRAVRRLTLRWAVLALVAGAAVWRLSRPSIAGDGPSRPALSTEPR